jgi:hypothetical protein
MTSDQVVDVLGTFVAQLDSNVPSSVARTATSGFPQVFAAAAAAAAAADGV